MDREIVFDRPLQLPRAAMGPSADLFFREGGKPSFNQIEPGSARGGEVHMEAWPLGQPRTNGRRFVRAVVVQDQNIQRFRDGGVDSIQKSPKLDSPMPPMALPDHLSGFHIQGGKKRHRPIASVAMGGTVQPVRGASAEWAEYDPAPESGTSHRRTRPEHARAD